MIFEKTQNVWKITDQFGDFIHLTEKELIELCGELYEAITKQIIYKDYRK